ncbi:AAA family ATPase [Paenarthrobacter sp. Z7-10]|uniref:helix-turn-helix transcriptional regulator n=1 Tax=Paenarthrobacter sp. Z7-10 TaxID=2787635 RepID=UPI0022A9CAD5|nr:LuxR family transcriptional regulator [Paenarthrobacter sp. Z7-10]MCZ2402961.1 AAA family ATPase [Paenarthrobacter sp. Z7-10]
MLQLDAVATGNAAKTEIPSRTSSAETESYPYCRQETVAELLDILRDRAGCGAVLVGDHGTGKSFLARKAIEQLREDSLVLQAQGSSIASTMPYGALRSLLNELDDAVVDHPMNVVRSLGRYLAQRAKDRRVILFVDNVQDLDELSALVVTQLAANGSVRLLAVCDDLPKAPGELIALWKDDLVQRIDVGPFNQRETTAWLRNSLGADVSRAAGEALWDASGGNPRFLEMILAEQIETQTVIRQDGVWVLAGKSFQYDTSTVSTVLTSLKSLSAPERQVMDILALTGGMALDDLMLVSDAAAIDSLEQRGSLQITAAGPAWVRLSNRLMAQVIRRRIPSGRSRELHALVTGALIPSEEVLTTSLALASWALDCGAELSQQDARTAAGSANRAGRPLEALRLLAYLEPEARREAKAEEARAYMTLGKPDKARSLLAAEDFGDAALDQWVEVMLLRSMLMRSDTDLDPRSALDEVQARLDASAAEMRSEQDTQELGKLREELALARADLAIHDGRYREVAEDLQRLYSQGSTAAHRLQAGSGLCRSLALTGRQSEARKLASVIDAQLNEAGMAPLSGEPADWAISNVLFAGTAQQRVAMPGADIPSGTVAGARSATVRELTDGLVHAYCGRAERALTHLLPALCQFKQLDGGGASEVAAAAVAYSYALLGENDRALHFLSSGSTSVAGVTSLLGRGKSSSAGGAGLAGKSTSAGLSAGHATSRLVSSACAYFQVLASAELASKEKATVRLFSLADDERRVRATSIELVFLCAAVRQGCSGGAQRLITAAGTVQGRFAQLCGVLGTGILKQDTTLLLQAAETAADMGDDLFARDAARVALKIGTDAADRGVMRAAQQRIRSSVQRLGGVKQSSEDGQALTAREQEVASWAAAGVSNREIAAKMSISVRTVEGHLYQVYGKLQVTNRAELKNTFA